MPLRQQATPTGSPSSTSPPTAPASSSARRSPKTPTTTSTGTSTWTSATRSDRSTSPPASSPNRRPRLQRRRPLRRHDRRRLQGLLHHQGQAPAARTTPTKAPTSTRPKSPKAGTLTLHLDRRSGPATPTPATRSQTPTAPTGTRSAPTEDCGVVAIGGGGGVASESRLDLLPLPELARQPGTRHRKTSPTSTSPPRLSASLHRHPRARRPARPRRRDGSRDRHTADFQVTPSGEFAAFAIALPLDRPRRKRRPLRDLPLRRRHRRPRLRLLQPHQRPRRQATPASPPTASASPTTAASSSTPPTARRRATPTKARCL